MVREAQTLHKNFGHVPELLTELARTYSEHRSRERLQNIEDESLSVLVLTYCHVSYACKGAPVPRVRHYEIVENTA